LRNHSVFAQFTTNFAHGVSSTNYFLHNQQPKPEFIPPGYHKLPIL